MMAVAELDLQPLRNLPAWLALGTFLINDDIKQKKRGSKLD